MDFLPKDTYNAEDLAQIVHILRSPGGCPWDREQTHASIRMNFIEEAYEAVEAIDAGDAGMLAEELGDVLLQVALHAEMEAELGVFDFDDVCDGICKKLIYRHPHVFGDVHAETSQQVLKNWDELKKKEKHQKTAASNLEAVPVTLPGAMRLAKLQKRAAGYGFGWADAAQAAKTAATAAESLAAAGKDTAEAQQAVQALLFAAIGAARLAGVDAELALTRASEQFTAAIGNAEQAAGDGGLAALSPQQKQQLWEKTIMVPFREKTTP